MNFKEFVDFILFYPKEAVIMTTIITGKHNTAKIFTTNIEQSAKDQIQALCDQPAFSGSKIRIMPDVHAGAGCVIGTTMTITDKVVPNLVGVDIGCSVTAIKLPKTTIDLDNLDRFIRNSIPSGFNIRETPHAVADMLDFTTLYCPFNHDRALRSIGTLGGGNHYIEIGRDNEGNLWLSVHTGSRHLGLQIAEYYQKLAVTKCNSIDTKALIAKLKAEGKHSQIQSAIAEIKAQQTAINPDFAYVEGDDLFEYLNDMEFAQFYAAMNGRVIINEILKELGEELSIATAVAEECIFTMHNYIEPNTNILRKGAISAQKDETILIPLNMRDGTLICKGKGNPDWNFSAPHGAGRILSRAQARKQLSLQDFQQTMEGIHSSSVVKETIDESPEAYKPMQEIIDSIGDTAEIITQIKPIYNFKAV